MGGDYGPKVVIPAALRVLKKHLNLRLILVGDREFLQRSLKRYNKRSSIERIIIQHASEIVTMDESPALALRTKKDSSMRVAINLVKEGRAQACVSAGNTGALMATSKFVLKTLTGIDRPAIISTLPTIPGHPVHMLDLGANLDSTPEQLCQFAVMGSVLTQAVENIDRPKVALLNVGEEEIKGNLQVKETSALLKRLKAINYVGYIEGDGIYKGDVDVVVCDGFVGNIALKAMEGTAKLIGAKTKEAFKRNWLTRLSAVCMLFVIKAIKKRLDPAQYNGASLIGLAVSLSKATVAPKLLDMLMPLKKPY